MMVPREEVRLGHLSITSHPPVFSGLHLGWLSPPQLWAVCRQELASCVSQEAQKQLEREAWEWGTVRLHGAELRWAGGQGVAWPSVCCTQ